MKDTLQRIIHKMRDHLIESPCIAVCKLDAEGRFCTGCYRTVDEITDWPKLGRADKYAVIENARKRRETR
jgi:predicted Fe-S protein YdhL (DUF1289 family)